MPGSILSASPTRPFRPRPPRDSPTSSRIPTGLDFTVGFVDRVVRPEDSKVAARNLRILARHTPKFLPVRQRLLLKLGAVVSVLMPGLVVRQARRTLRRLVGHLVIDARPAQLGKAIKKLRKRGDRLNLNLLGEAVLGEREATRRRDGTRELLERDDVDYVSIKVSAVASQLSMWAFDETVDRVVDRLTPLYEQGRRATARSSTSTWRSTATSTSRSRCSPGCSSSHVPRPRGRHRAAGLPARLRSPPCRSSQAWATSVAAAGGARIKVRVVKGANLAMERVDAAVHGWPLATWATKQETDTNYKRVLDWALHARAHRRRAHRRRRTQPLRPRLRLAARRRAGRSATASSSRCCSAWPPAPGTPSATTSGSCCSTRRSCTRRSSTSRSATSCAASRRTRAATTSCRRPSTSHRRRSAFERESQRFLDSVKALDARCPSRSASQDRSHRAHLPAHRRLRERPPTPTRPLDANRQWGRHRPRAVRRTRSSAWTRSRRTACTARPACRRSIAADPRGWKGLGCPRSRRAVVGAAPGRRGARRRDVATSSSVMAAETGKTIAEADVEVSEAIDFAHYYAESALRARRRRRSELRAGEADRRHSAVELPGRDPGRLGARGARGRQRRASSSRPTRAGAAPP